MGGLLGGRACTAWPGCRPRLRAAAPAAPARGPACRPAGVRESSSPPATVRQHRQHWPMRCNATACGSTVQRMWRHLRPVAPLGADAQRRGLGCAALVAVLCSTARTAVGISRRIGQGYGYRLQPRREAQDVLARAVVHIAFLCTRHDPFLTAQLQPVSQQRSGHGGGAAPRRKAWTWFA